MDKIQRLLIDVYGLKDGLRIASVVLPNIFTDFRGMLKKTMPGLTVTEEYKFEDRTGGIKLSGIRKGDECYITSFELSGSQINLSDQPLRI